VRSPPSPRLRSTRSTQTPSRVAITFAWTHDGVDQP
jgi:hypothetical protein